MFNRIQPDKWKHFWVGIAMGIVLQGLGLWLLPEWPLISILLPLLIVVVVSYGFELFSRVTGKGHYEIMDAVAAIIGGVIGMAGTLVAAAGIK